jgi:hypothetical protein
MATRWFQNGAISKNTLTGSAQILYQEVVATTIVLVVGEHLVLTTSSVLISKLVSQDSKYGSAGLSVEVFLSLGITIGMVVGNVVKAGNVLKRKVSGCKNRITIK